MLNNATKVAYVHTVLEIVHNICLCLNLYGQTTCMLYKMLKWYTVGNCELMMTKWFVYVKSCLSTQLSKQDILAQDVVVKGSSTM